MSFIGQYKANAPHTPPHDPPLKNSVTKLVNLWDSLFLQK